MVEDKLKQYLKKPRLEHSLNVALEARKLAKIYGENEDDAYICGLVHDVSKYIPYEEQLKLIEKYNTFPIYENELSSENLVHSITGAIIAKSEFQINDEKILSAIRYHTLGRVNMTTFEKIIYIADLISYDRNYKGVEKIRKLAYNNLDSAIIQSINNTVAYLNEKNEKINDVIIKVRCSLMNSLEKAKEIAKLVDSKKAYDIEVIEVGDVTSITDYFVICSANSEPQIKSIADEVEFKLKEQGITPTHVEGYKSATWILLDYDDVIVHVFNKESRMFYSLERLWGDAKRIELNDILD